MYANKSDEKYFDSFLFSVCKQDVSDRIKYLIKLVLFGTIERKFCCTYACGDGLRWSSNCKNRGFDPCGLRDKKEYNYGVLYDNIVDRLRSNKELIIRFTGKMRYQQFMADLTNRTIKYLNDNYTRKQIKDKRRGVIKPYDLEILTLDDIDYDPWSKYIIEIRKTEGDSLCSLF